MTTAETALQKADQIILQALKSKAESVDLRGLGLITLPVSIVRLTQIQQLNLGENRLIALPESICQLTRLRVLILDDNRLTSLPESICRLTRLQELHLYHNKLTALPQSIGQLGQLRELSLHGNRLTVLPESIRHLRLLLNLGLSDNALTAVPDSIRQLDQLRFLYLSGIQSPNLPEWLGELTNLVSLILHNSQLTILPEWMGQLTQLVSLGLAENQLIAIPEWIGRLRQLNGLFLQRNQLTVLPESIRHLVQLERLYLNDNRLTSLPESIGQLTRLRELLLNNNLLSALPESIGQLTRMQGLDLSGNRLTGLPDEIHRISSLKALYLHDNHRLQLPPEVLGPRFLEVDESSKSVEPADPRAILAYYQQIHGQSNRPLSEAKILLVGQGDVGKTSLVRYLIHDQPCKPGEPPTKGIRREYWSRKTRHPQKRATHPVILNVWDFGGQEIMHATHQFFLTKRSLYLLVLDARTTEAENNLYYWLKVIQSFGGDAPVVIVVNKTEEEISLELNENRLRKDFAPNLKGFCRVSCKTGIGIPALRKAIDAEVRMLPHVFDPVPSSYFKVKAQLGTWAGRKNYISYAKYQMLCNECGVTEEANQQQLLRFLHDLGIALNFDDPNDPYELKDTNVLDPAWVTDAVYRVITSPVLKEARGVFLRDELAGLLKNNKRFPHTQHQFIIELMRKFELCFDFPDSFGDRFLVPERLDKDEPDIGWNEHQSLNFQVRYNVLPPGLVCRFIVKMYKHLKTDSPTYWRDGAVLYVYGNRCLVRGSIEDRRIYIAIQGDEKTRRDALSVIREKLAEIRHTIKGLEVAELVPVPGQPKVTVEYTTLVKMQQHGIDLFLPEGADKAVNSSDLLRLVDTEQRLLSHGIKKGVLLVNWIQDNFGENTRDIQPSSSLSEVGRNNAESVIAIPKQVDFGIITIKEEEFTAVEKQFEPVRILRGGKRPYLHSVVTIDGKTQNVLIARCLEQGQSDAHQCTNDLLHDANPGWILLVGIAGAFPAAEYTLGDVLLASRVYDFAVTAAIEGQLEEQSPKGGAVHPDVSRLLQLIPSKACQAKLGEWNGSTAISMPKPALNIPRKLGDPPFYGSREWRKKVQAGLMANFPDKESARAPLYRITSAATGNTLVKDTERAAVWKTVGRAIGHIEMELGGVYVAAQAVNKPVLSIRGVSDVVGFRRSSAWTEYACQSAAAFARALIASGLIDPKTT